MKNNLLVSVIIPCYNVKDYINGCIESVLNQSYNSIEIICVDNNSTDETLSILKLLKSKFNIKVFKCLEKGANNARNLGVEKSKGQWIQFLDADDIILPNKIECQVDEILKNNNLDLIFSPFMKRSIDNIKSNISCDEVVELGLFNTKLGITSSNLFKSSTIKSSGMWDVNQESSQEYELMFRFYKNKAIFKYSNHNMTIVQTRKSGQISTLNLKENWERYVDLRIEMINFFKEKSIYLSQQNKILINQILFDLLRILIKFNRLKAVNIYNEYLPYFSPKKSTSSGNVYIFIFRIFGFSLTEKIRSSLFLN